MKDSEAQSPPELTLRVIEARGRDVGRNMARIGPDDLDAIGLSPGQPVEIVGRKRTVASVMPSLGPDSLEKTIQIDGITRGNADVGLDEQVALRPLSCSLATHVSLTPASGTMSERAQGIDKHLGKLLSGMPVLEGDLVRVSLFGVSNHDFKVVSCDPGSPAVIQLGTSFNLVEADATPPSRQLLVYEDIGGLKQEVERLREMVEIPLKHPEVFDRLGVSAPRAILLAGPPGVGKSLMARVVAEAAQANFFATSGSEILHKYYTQSETHLRDIFQQAVTHRPSVIFIDELEHIASRQCFAATKAEKYTATELLTLVDHLERNGRVTVIGSSTNADEIDPTFRRHGRFEREISVRAPKRRDRLEILEIHSRGIPLAQDVDLQQLAALAQGFVGADLSILCQEAVLVALRRRMLAKGYWGEPTYDLLAEIDVTMAHFLEALRSITPSLPESSAAELPEIRWNDIGGLDHIRAQLTEAVTLPLRSPELFTRVGARPVRGVLLHGPAGTGKSSLAQAVARETDITFFPIKAGDVLGGDASAGGRAIRDLFRRARQMAPSIIFLDEIDAMTPPRTPSGEGSRVERVLSQLIAEIDATEQLRGVVVLGATNHLDQVDVRLLRPGRFDLLLEIPLPDSEALREIFHIHLRDRPLADDVDLGVLVKLAGGFSGADVKVVCQMAATNAIKEHCSEKKAPKAELRLAQRHLAAAIAEMCMQKLEEK